MFTPEEKKQIENHGISMEAIDKQIQNFKTGFPWMKVLEPAIIEKGITQISKENLEKLGDFYEEKVAQLKVMKFTPASGAASRMFKELFDFLQQGQEIRDMATLKKEYPITADVVENMESMALYDDLASAFARDNKEITQLKADGNYTAIIEKILDPDGLNYGQLPKGLIQFHKYPNENRTAVEEHLTEGSLYAKNADGKVYLHLTVSPEHKEKFEEKLKSSLPDYEKKYGVSYDVSYSVQDPATDIIAVDMNNEPFRDNLGVVFRPGGHGALLKNLGNLDADIIFIKNIDNVTTDRLKRETVEYKKALAGFLLELKEQINAFLVQFDEEEPEENLLEESMHFLKNNIGIIPPSDIIRSSIEEKKKWCRSMLNRPIRVCGMVKNEGEPGGGPFWAKNPDSSISLQIVESSQIDLKNENLKVLVERSTHFNPVDIVCSIKDYKGKKFNLEDYRDDQTGFIATKSKDGKELKAQELPGLWNGAMSGWNTVFIEVPIATFNPVKTIADLLRPGHIANVNN